MRVIDKTASTVGELIDILKEILGDYSISLTGMHTYAVAVDDENKGVLLDNPKWIEDTIRGMENDC